MFATTAPASGRIRAMVVSLLGSDKLINRPRFSQIAANALLATALLGVLGFLIAKTRNVDFDTHNLIVANLRDLKQIDAQWNIDIFKSKTGINNNYDPVAQPLAVIRQLAADLKAKTSQTPGNDALAGKLKSFEDAMNTKIVAIERFKSQNAIYRNSTRYLPTAYAALIDSAKQSGMPAAKLSELDVAWSAAFSDTLTYNLTPEPGLKDAVTTKIAALEERAAIYPPDVAAAAMTLSAHMSTTLKQQELGAMLLDEVSRFPTAKKVDELSDAYGQVHESRLFEQQFYRQCLIVYSGLLLIFLAYLGFRLLRSYKQLGVVASDLRIANFDLRESQAQLVQSEKMSALGQMVAGIAHEINTPLAYVKGTLDVIKERMGSVRLLADTSHAFATKMQLHESDPDAERPEHLVEGFVAVSVAARTIAKSNHLGEMDTMIDDGSHGIEKISEIIRSLKNFSRLDRAQISDYQLSEGIDSTLVLANSLLKGKVVVEREYGEVPSVTCSPSQINQVFLNIITNAAQAMGDAGGKLVIRVERHDVKTVRVEISDDGEGIPTEVVPKIFDPFYTTKAIGVGTGMGLSISYKIIEAHGGKILVDTERGIGTCFTILLPIRQPKTDKSVFSD